MTYTFAVVTEAEPNGNMALAGDLFWSTGERDDRGLEKVRPFLDALNAMLDNPQRAAGFWLSMREPVFHVGEVLILDESGREIGYPGRKPSKWYVEVVELDSLEEAHALARKVLDESLNPTPESGDPA